MVHDKPVTVTIRRRVKAGQDAAFEVAVREFIPQSLRHPGHLGVQVLRPSPGTSSEWVVVIKFQTRGHYDTFRTSDEYTQWCTQLRELLEEEPVYEEQCGLESWFVLPGATAQPVLPRWKMALVSWIGVSSAVISLKYLVAPMVAEWPLVPQQLVMTGLTVMLLTWVIMPFLTRLFKPFLYPARRGGEALAMAPASTPAHGQISVPEQAAGPT